MDLEGGYWRGREKESLLSLVLFTFLSARLPSEVPFPFLSGCLYFYYLIKRKKETREKQQGLAKWKPTTRNSKFKFWVPLCIVLATVELDL